MTGLLFSVILAAVLSLTSLLTVLLRVSPLTSPGQALSTFFLSLFLGIMSVGCLAMYGLWKVVPLHTWDDGTTLRIALRQGFFLAAVVVLTLLFHLLGILTWWAAATIVAIFVLIELALHY